MKKAAWISAAAAVLAVFAGGGLLLKSALKPTKTTVAVDRGYFYRLQARYEYLGQPVNFDIVVGCDVHIAADRPLLFDGELAGLLRPQDAERQRPDDARRRGLQRRDLPPR
jgi:hypothetical protein